MNNENIDASVFSTLGRLNDEALKSVEASAGRFIQEAEQVIGDYGRLIIRGHRLPVELRFALSDLSRSCGHIRAAVVRLKNASHGYM